MPNNELINKPKLNIFQRIRKNFLIRRNSVDSYKKAPAILQNDSEVIDGLMKNTPLNLEFLSINNGLDYLSTHPDVIQKNPKKIRNIYLNKMPELFKNLDEKQQLCIIFLDRKYDFFKELPDEKQKEFLLNKTDNEIFVEEAIPFLPRGVTFNSNSYDNSNTSKYGNLEVLPSFFYDKLDLLNENVLISVLTKYSLDYNSKNQYSDDEKIRNKYFNAEMFFKNIKIDNLPMNTQLKLALLDNRLIDKMSYDAIEKYVGKNPLLINLIPSEKIGSFIEKNPKFIKMLNNDEWNDYIVRPEFSKYIPTREFRFRWNKIKGLNYEDTIKIATVGNDSYSDLGTITDSVKDSNLLWEVAKTIPESLSIENISESWIYLKKLDYIKDMLSKKIDDPKILKAINSSSYFNYNFQNNIENFDVQNMIFKIITDEKVLTRCNSDKIVEFINNPQMDILHEIVGETYGNQARRVLESRPGLTFENIPNLRIFDEAIFENFGEGVVHNQLSYDTKFSILLADMANHPEKIQEYKKFERLTDGLFQESSASNESKYKSFVELYDLISSIDEKNMTEERKQALKLAVSDLDFSETNIIPLENINDLDNYVEVRNKMYDDAFKKTTDIFKQKDIFSRKIFGMKYEERINSNYTVSKLSLNGMLQYYSIDNLLNDKRTHESDLFNKDELDMLEVAKIINEIDDSKVLMNVYEELSSDKNIIGPLDFESIKQKIPIQYSRELVSQLLTPEKALEMVEKNEKGISIEHSDDNIYIINLHGADFKIMMHSFMGRSGGKTNSGFRLPSGKTLNEIWNNYEQGCSTISNCLIEPDMLKSCGSDGDVVNFGFCNIDPRLIIGMSHHDAHVSHRGRKPNPDFQYDSLKMNYPEELLRKTAAQITGQENKDLMHEYNEVTINRREQDLKNITNENYGGRILPDYIVVYGKSTEQHRNLSKEFAKNGKPLPIIEIDREAYKDRLVMRANKKDKEHLYEKEEDSDLISSIKNISNFNENER